MSPGFIFNDDDSCCNDTGCLTTSCLIVEVPSEFDFRLSSSSCDKLKFPLLSKLYLFFLPISLSWVLVNVLNLSGRNNLHAPSNSTITRSPYFVVSRFILVIEYSLFFSMVDKFNQVKADNKLNFLSIFCLYFGMIYFFVISCLSLWFDFGVSSSLYDLPWLPLLSKLYLFFPISLSWLSVIVLYLSGKDNLQTPSNSTTKRSPYCVVCRLILVIEYSLFFSMVDKFNHVQTLNKLNLSSNFWLFFEMVFFFVFCCLLPWFSIVLSCCCIIHKHTPKNSCYSCTGLPQTDERGESSSP